jgi:hypothetical protein
LKYRYSSDSHAASGLGPNPGAGGDRKSDDFESNSHGDLIPAWVVSDLRR